MLPPLKPIPIKDRLSIVFVEKGEIDVVDGAFVVVDQQGFRVRPVLTHIPVGGVACIMLEPGTRVSHAAAALAARVGMNRSEVSDIDASITAAFPTCVGMNRIGGRQHRGSGVIEGLFFLVATLVRLSNRGTKASVRH